MSTPMTALDSICVYVEKDGDVVLQKIVQGKQPQPWGIYFGLTEICNGALDKELMSYGCKQKDVTAAIKAVMEEEYYTEVIV